jgi:hypothetical protein
MSHTLILLSSELPGIEKKNENGLPVTPITKY